MEPPLSAGARCFDHALGLFQEWPLGAMLCCGGWPTAGSAGAGLHRTGRAAQERGGVLIPGTLVGRDSETEGTEERSGEQGGSGAF